MIQPLKQTIFETGPKAPSISPLPVIQYQEDPTVIPNPINPAQAVDPGVNWWGLGAQAMAVAGELFGNTLDYIIDGQKTDMAALGMDLSTKTEDLYQEVSSEIDAASTEGRDFDVNKLVTLDQHYQELKTEFDTKAKGILGDDKYEFYTKADDLSSLGTKYRELALATRGSYYEVDKNITKVMSDLTSQTKALLKSNQARQQDITELNAYKLDGTLIEPATLKKYVNPHYEAYRHPDISPEQREQRKEMVVDQLIPNNSGQLNTFAKEIISKGLDNPNASDLDRELSVTMIGRMTEDQISASTTSQAEHLKYAYVKQLLTYTSDGDTARKLKEDPFDSQVFGAILLDYDSNEYVKYMTANKDTFVGDNFGDIRATVIAAYMAKVNETYPDMTVAEATVVNSPYFKPLLYSALRLSKEDPENSEENLSGLLQQTVNSNKVKVTEDGTLRFSSYVNPVEAKVELKFGIYNLGRVKPMTVDELTAKSSLSIPLTESSVPSEADNLMQAMDNALRFSRKAVNRDLFLKISGGMRSKDKTADGVEITGGASKAQLLRLAVATSDEVLKVYNAAINGVNEVPTDPEIIISLARVAYRATPPADTWDVHVSYVDDKSVIDFSSIPFFDPATGETKNLLEMTNIVPVPLFHDERLRLLTPDGRGNYLQLENVLDANGELNITEELKEHNAYLDKLINKQDTSREAKPNVTINERTVEESGEEYFRQTPDIVSTDTSDVPTGTVHVDDRLAYGIAAFDLESKSPELFDTLLETDWTEDKKPPSTDPTVNPRSGLVVTKQSKNGTLQFLLSSSTSKVYASYVSKSFGISEEAAAKLVTTILTTDYKFGRDGKTIPFEELMWRRHAGKPLMDIHFEIMALAEYHLKGYHHEEAVYLPESGFPSANTDMNLRASEEEVNSWFQQAPDLTSGMFDEDNPSNTGGWGFGMGEGGDGDGGGPGGDGDGSNGVRDQLRFWWDKWQDGAGGRKQRKILGWWWERDYNESKDQGPTNPLYDQVEPKEVPIQAVPEGQIWEYNVPTNTVTPPTTTPPDGYLPPPTPEGNSKYLPAPGAVSGKQSADVEPANIQTITRSRFPVNLTSAGRPIAVTTTVFQETPNSPFILIPNMFEGKYQNGKAAIQHYVKTGEHFGYFSSREKAESYGKQMFDREQMIIEKAEDEWTTKISEGGGLDRFAAKNPQGVWVIGNDNPTHPNGAAVKEGDIINVDQAEHYLRHAVYNTIIPALSQKPQWHQLDRSTQAEIIAEVFNRAPETSVDKAVAGIQIPFPTSDWHADVERSTLTISSQNFPPRLNEDGSVSNVLTMSFSEGGPEILIPMMVNGKKLTQAQAIDRYHKTNEHFGKFSTVALADAYGKQLHKEQERDIKAFETKWHTLLGKAEGLRLKAYNNDGVWTIGKGSTTHPNGKPVKKGDVITKAQADLYMRHFTYNVLLPQLEKTIPNWDIMSENQQLALISFGYNVGQNFFGAQEKETITAALSSRDTWNKVPAALALYNKGREYDGGPLVVLPGLVKRRAEEARLWSDR